MLSLNEIFNMPLSDTEVQVISHLIRNKDALEFVHRWIFIYKFPPKNLPISGNPSSVGN